MDRKQLTEQLAANEQTIENNKLLMKVIKRGFFPAHVAPLVAGAQDFLTRVNNALNPVVADLKNRISQLPPDEEPKEAA